MEEYQFGDWSSGGKHLGAMTLNVRPQQQTENPIFIGKIFSPEGRQLSLQTEAQITTLDVDAVSTTTEGADGPNVTDIAESWTGSTKSDKETLFRAVPSVVRDEVRKCKAVVSCCKIFIAAFGLCLS